MACALALCGAQAAAGEDAPSGSVPDRIEELQEDLDSLIEDVDDLREPVEEFDLFDECMYLIGVSEHGRDGSPGFRFVDERGRASVRPALFLDIRGFGRPAYQLLAFPGEEPPSIECNEDAGEEDIDD